VSTNFYLRKPDGQEIHLGKTALGWPFMFRGYPERGITNYKAWRAQLDLGEIRTEAGAPVTSGEMVQIVTNARAHARVEEHRPFGYDVDDAQGNRFTLVEFS
jgi:hypothetical protein